MKRFLAALLVALLCVVLPGICAAEPKEPAPVFQELVDLAKTFPLGDVGTHFNMWKSIQPEGEVVYILVFVPEGCENFSQVLIGKFINGMLFASAGFRFDTYEYMQAEMGPGMLLAMPMDEADAVATATWILNEIRNLFLKPISFTYPSDRGWKETECVYSGSDDDPCFFLSRHLMML